MLNGGSEAWFGTDLSTWGIGSANNGGGIDGEEFTLSGGTAATGDVIVIAGNTASFDFFANNFVQNFVLLQHGAAKSTGTMRLSCLT